MANLKINCKNICGYRILSIEIYILADFIYFNGDEFSSPLKCLNANIWAFFLGGRFWASPGLPLYFFLSGFARLRPSWPCPHPNYPAFQRNRIPWIALKTYPR
jgi:hypothetical protein